MVLKGKEADRGASTRGGALTRSVHLPHLAADRPLTQALLDSPYGPRSHTRPLQKAGGALHDDGADVRGRRSAGAEAVRAR